MPDMFRFRANPPKLWKSITPDQISEALVIFGGEYRSERLDVPPLPEVKPVAPRYGERDGYEPGDEKKYYRPKSGITEIGVEHADGTLMFSRNRSERSGGEPEIVDVYLRRKKWWHGLL